MSLPSDHANETNENIILKSYGVKLWQYHSNITVMNLPVDIIVIICEHLNDREKLSLFSTCRSMLANISYLRFQEIHDYDSIKHLTYFNCFQGVLYRMIDSNTKFPSKLTKIDIYNLSFLLSIPNPKTIKEIKVRCIDHDIKILMNFENLEVLHICQSFEQFGMIIVLPPRVRKLHVNKVRFLRIDTKGSSLTEVNAPYSSIHFTTKENLKNLEKIVCYSTNFCPSKSFIALNHEFPISYCTKHGEKDTCDIKSALSSDKISRLPSTLKKLRLTGSAVPIYLPPKLKSFAAGGDFDKPIRYLPETLEKLDLPLTYKRYIDLSNLKNLKLLKCGLACLPNSNAYNTSTAVYIPNAQNLENLTTEFIPIGTYPKLKVLCITDHKNIRKNPRTNSRTNSRKNPNPRSSKPKRSSKRKGSKASRNHKTEPEVCDSIHEDDIYKDIRQTVESMQNLEEFYYLGKSESMESEESKELQYFIDLIALSKKLRKLFTTIVPKALSQSIEELVLHNDFVSSTLPELPSNLKRLYIQYVKPELMDFSNPVQTTNAIKDNASNGTNEVDTCLEINSLPDTIQEMVIYGPYKSVKLPQNLPKSLKSLMLSGNAFDEYKLDIPYGLKKLVTPSRIFFKLPDSIEYLIARSIDEGIELPSKLRTLILSKYDESLKLPDSLEILKIGRCETISKLPKNLRVLKIQVCKKILFFPEYIEKVKIYHYESIASFKRLKVFETEEVVDVNSLIKINGIVRIKTGDGTFMVKNE